MLALSRSVHYVHEPFAPMYERSWLRSPPMHRFYHEPPSVRGRYAHDLCRIAALRPPWLPIARRAGGMRNAMRIAQEAVHAAVARRRGARALIKDPFALLSAEWIAARSQAQVVLLVRHPAAFASSIKRLGWRLDVGWLLDQPALMSGDLAPFRAELEADQRGGSDLLDHAALVWRAFNSVVLRYSRDHPDWCLVRYETLAEDPVGGFRTLFETLGLAWDSRTLAEIQKRNSRDNVGEVAVVSKGGIQRHSRAAMWTWLNRLTDDEIKRVRVATNDVAHHWYDDQDWTQRPDN